MSSFAANPFKMTKRKIYLHAMRFVDVQPNIPKEDNNNKKENLTKDRKIKLDKIINGSGFKEI